MPTLFFAPACEPEISNIIKNSKSAKQNNGYDEISLCFIKLYSTVLVSVLVLFVNSAFTCKLVIFPDCLKLAKVIPVFKKCDKLDVNSNRPISLLTCLSKIFEKTIFSRLMSF